MKEKEEKNKTKLNLSEIESWGMAHEFETMDEYFESIRPKTTPESLKLLKEWEKNNKKQTQTMDLNKKEDK